MNRCTPTTIETLGCAQLLQELPIGDLRQLSSVARRRTYRRRGLIFHQGDPAQYLYVIESGCVALTVRDTEGMRMCMLDVLAAGDLCGELSLHFGAEHSFTAEALGEVAVVVVPAVHVRDVIQAHLELMGSLTQLLGQQIARLAELMADRDFLNLDERLAKGLLRLADQHGRQVGDGVELRMPLNQSNLAALSGATRTSVNRVLGLYEDQGLVRRPRSSVMVIDVPRLQHRVP